jgi:hypothetical protein
MLNNKKIREKFFIFHCGVLFPWQQMESLGNQGFQHQALPAPTMETSILMHNISRIVQVISSKTSTVRPRGGHYTPAVENGTIPNTTPHSSQSPPSESVKM